VTLRVGMAVPRELAEAKLLDKDGKVSPLGDAWAERDALVVFVRHFACAGCSEHVTELAPRLLELDALGVRTVIVGCGRAEHIAGFIERHGLGDKHVEVLTDPTLEAQKRANLVRSAWGTLGPLGLAGMLGAMTRGHKNGPTEGDLYQMGGTLLVRRGGELSFYGRSARVGDHAPVVDVIDVALRLRAQDCPIP
jgi:peroxiredoxin